MHRFFKSRDQGQSEPTEEPMCNRRDEICIVVEKMKVECLKRYGRRGMREFDNKMGWMTVPSLAEKEKDERARLGSCNAVKGYPGGRSCRFQCCSWSKLVLVLQFLVLATYVSGFSSVFIFAGYWWSIYKLVTATAPTMEYRMQPRCQPRLQYACDLLLWEGFGQTISKKDHLR